MALEERDKQDVREPLVTQELAILGKKLSREDALRLYRKLGEVLGVGPLQSYPYWYRWWLPQDIDKQPINHDIVVTWRELNGDGTGNDSWESSHQSYLDADKIRNGGMK